MAKIPPDGHLGIRLCLHMRERRCPKTSLGSRDPGNLATMSRVGPLNDTERALHHLALGSTDVERLATFYRELVGLREVARHADAHGQLRSIWLDLGGAVLMIERTEQPARRVDGIGAGPFLLAFRVSPSERRQIEVALEANGHAIEGRTPFTSYSRDVDGNRVAFSHHPVPSALGPTPSPERGDAG